jgi:kynurenine formamidase
MKFFTPKAPENKYIPTHKWFAWYPIRTLRGEIVWLETVYRKRWGDSRLSYWEYSV